EGWAILLRQKQKKLIMLPSETMIWQPEFTDKTLSRKPGAVQTGNTNGGQTVLAFCAGPGTVLSRSSTVRLSDWD
ncbi:hypothetical protein, partial [Escherichia coli]